MPFQPNPFKPQSPYKNQIHSELLQANENFNVLAQAFKDNDPNTGIVKHAIMSDNAFTCLEVNISLTYALQIAYSRLYIQSQPPSNPNVYDSWYNTTDDILYFYSCKGEWQPLNWQKFIANDPSIGLGKPVNIVGNKLMVYGRTVYPAVGRLVEVVADDNNPLDDGKIVYLTIGQSLLVRNSSKIRVATVVNQMWQGYYFFKSVNSDAVNFAPTTPDTSEPILWFGIIPNNISILDGSGQVLIGDGRFDFGGGFLIGGAVQTPISTATWGFPVDNVGCVKAYPVYNAPFVPLMFQATDVNFGSFSIAIDHDYYKGDVLYTTGMGHTLSSIAGGICTGSGSLGESIWHLGSFCSNGYPMPVDYAVITRVY
ncbi:MAG: hypothetical protein JHC31_01515 [Sulfurihydrogenibium sp.]|nr:hypothetical protein [Sulfurihydrogenibium sp.]